MPEPLTELYILFHEFTIVEYSHEIFLTAVSYANRHPNFSSLLMCLKVSSVQHNVSTDSERLFNKEKYGTSRGTLKLRESLLTALLELLLAGELVL